MYSKIGKIEIIGSHGLSNQDINIDQLKLEFSYFNQFLNLNCSCVYP